MKIGLVACSKSKLEDAAPARKLYTSALFRGSLRRALATCDVVYVASALHGLVELDQVVAPYNLQLTELGKLRRLAWGLQVGDALAARHGKEPGVELVVFAGEAYAYPIRAAAFPRRWKVTEPLKGMVLGARLAELWNEPAAVA